MTEDLRYSFVIPARNEVRDIARTLEGIGGQQADSYEVIVIDDGSTDGTLDLVRSRRDAVRLFETTGGQGTAAARNLGIVHARSEVIVFLDADVVVPPDYLEQLGLIYARGPDFVAVESRIPDARALVSRFQQATHAAEYDGIRNTGFTQAFSCRREAATKIRFAENYPTNGGEDGDFYERLVRSGYTGIRAPWIVVDHHVPNSVPSLFRQWVGRGRSAAYVDHRLRARSRGHTAVRRLGASLREFLRVVTIVPTVAAGVRRLPHSPAGARDLAGFVALSALISVARGTGECQGAYRILIGR